MSIETLKTKADVERLIKQTVAEFGVLGLHNVSGALPTERLSGEITGDQIADGTVNTVDLAANAITQLYTTTATTSSPTSTSAADPMTAVIPEMTTTQDFGGDPLVIVFNGSIDLSGAQGANTGHIALYDGSTEIGNSRRTFQSLGNTVPWTLTTFTPYTPAAGNRTISARWRTGGGTLTARLLGRELLIVRLKR